ncbi:calmodulin-like protein 30 [Lactuca sativa]|uniref:calmodulin-like protein 30 n=1 Tax=Lactuca sativa TaxID=4236 RepID=UPI000CB6B8A3|nr:calmodulin-like protein 30 [Lactuca sativa]
MSKTSFLDIQYNISRRKFLRKPSRMFSSSDRQSSGLPIFQPNVTEMRRVFDKFDRDKDGKISRGEYKAIIRALKQGSTDRDVQKIFEVADLDGDGFISFKEFMEVQKKGGGVKAVDVQSAFRTFDMDGDGKITVEEVFELMKRLGERCSLQDCRKMVRAVDSNQDGVIDMDEFMTMMTQNTNI